MKREIFHAACMLVCLHFAGFSGHEILSAQSSMINPYARQTLSLNGRWQVIIDPTGNGDWRKVWEERQPEKKTDFFEYAFEGGPRLDVPGDFNSQRPELTYLEGTVWYKTTFTCPKRAGRRLFLHFGGVNYRADVYLNGDILGSHEGGFTPFQFEITDRVRPGENRIVVRADNHRLKDGLPGLGYDWFNYGGITRDVTLIETSGTYIEDYAVQLAPDSVRKVSGRVKLDGSRPAQKIRILIPELHVDYQTHSDAEGSAEIAFSCNPELWHPEHPKLYQVTIRSETDTVTDDIGFRTIAVRDGKLLLNGRPVFLKAVNIHEEMPLRAAKAWSESDALVLLTWARELGCNLVRLAHYPHSEHMVRLAEKMGLMVWSEIPVYQHIDFSAPGLEAKMDLMLREMVKRDRNRCGVIIWCLSNETWHFTPNRTEALIRLTGTCRQLDDTRLVTHVINTQGYDHNTITVWDTLYNVCDFIALNEYLGWYVPWQGPPEAVKWTLSVDPKPVFISEFGGEALFGSHEGPPDEAAWWNEEYQEQIYRDQTVLFRNVPNLAGVCPWILADFRSMGRLHPVYQEGWNRKGLLSDRGQKKKAWFVMKAYYESR